MARKPVLAVVLLLCHIVCFGQGDGYDDNFQEVVEGMELVRVGCAELAVGAERPFGPSAGESQIDEELAETCLRLLRLTPFQGELAAIGARGGVKVPRQLSISMDWYDDNNSYYLASVGIGVGIMLVLIVFEEGVFLRTTLFPCTKRAQRMTNQILRQLTTLRSKSEVKPCSGVSVDDKEKKQTQEEYESNEGAEAFWKTIERHAADNFVDVAPNEKARREDLAVVGFSRMEFAGLEKEKKAKITVERKGKLQGKVVVHVRTADDKTAGNGFKAKGTKEPHGEDYVHFETDLTFEDGVRYQSFIVTLLPTDTTWSPTRWFRVELTKVVEGEAVLGGPTVSSQTTESIRSVRVFILQDDTFPGGIPEEYLTKITDESSADANGKKPNPGADDMVFLRYYWVERMKARGRQFWYTLIGLCYEPIHASVVTPIVFSFMLDWAAEPQEGGNYSSIVGLVAIQLASYLLLRWGDVSQVRNRGRTGACRMAHRKQLMSKLLLMEHVEQWEKPGDDWFYASLMNVDTMVMEAYWQLYIMIQSLWGLLLVLAVLFWKGWYQASQKGTRLSVDNFLPALVLLVLTPLAFFLIARRRGKVADLLEKRMESEEDWVQVFSWLAQNGTRLYTLGMRELAKIETTFANLSKIFLKHHQSARDLCNDSTWIMKWLGGGMYTVILMWASLRLLQSRAGLGKKFASGDCVLLVQLVDKFTKYLTKVSNSFVSMQKGAVSIRRVSKLLSLKECKSLLELASDSLKMEHIIDPKATEDFIEMENISIRVPKRKDLNGFGPVVDIDQLPGDVLRIPLGKVICIKGGSEAQRVTFLVLLAQLVRPQEGGRLTFPSGEWCLLAPPAPVCVPNRTVAEDFESAGLCKEGSRTLARAFGLNPDQQLVRVPPGAAQVQALVKYMLRDSTVLLVARPIGSSPIEMADRVRQLLFAWQSSGGGSMLCHTVEAEEERFRNQDSVATRQSVHERIGRNRRTMVISGESMDDVPGVHQIDLSKHFRDFCAPPLTQL